MKLKQKHSNYEYFVHADTFAFKGEWIAIVEKKLLLMETTHKKYITRQNANIHTVIFLWPKSQMRPSSSFNILP